MADQANQSSFGLAPAPGEDNSSFPAQGERQIGTEATLRLDKATGNITRGPTRPLMGKSIPVSEF